MKTIVTLIVGLMAGAAGFWYFSGPRTSPTRSQSTQPLESANEQSGLEDSTADVRREVGRLAAEVAALRRQVATAPVEAPPPMPKGATPHPIDMHDPDAKAKAKRERDERVADVEAEFRAETHDPLWSSPTESAIRNAVRDANLLQGSLKNVECQTKTCRVELAVTDPVQLSRELPNLMPLLSGQLHSSVMDFVDNPQGGRTGVLYLFR
jgi:hypothetical protein